MNMMPKMMKPFMTQFSSNFKSALFCLHSSVHSSGCIDIMLFREPRATALFRLLPYRGGWSSTDSRSFNGLTVEQLLYWSDSIWTGLGAQIDAKTKFRFGNIVPKQLTLSGLVQHTSASSMYKDNDNRISQQQKINAWTCNTFSNEFKRRNRTTLLMAKSPRKHTLCTPLSIGQLFIFGIFEHKWGTRKHIDDLKKILMVHTSTKGN